RDRKQTEQVYRSQHNGSGPTQFARERVSGRRCPSPLSGNPAMFPEREGGPASRHTCLPGDCPDTPSQREKRRRAGPPSASFESAEGLSFRLRNEAAPGTVWHSNATVL